MNPELDELLEELESRLSAADLEESEATTKASEAREKQANIQSALDRLNLIRGGKIILDRDICRDCFIEHNRQTKMRDRPSESSADLYYCPKCDEEKELPP